MRSSLEAEFHKKLEVIRETARIRNVETRGGYYSEADMKKPISEKGLAYTTTLVRDL